jgi:hypothetical protein
MIAKGFFHVNKNQFRTAKKVSSQKEALHNSNAPE